MEQQMKDSKVTYKIKPILIQPKRVHEFYEKIMILGYGVKIWNKKKDSKLYKFYLPVMREQMFWTFGITDEEKFNKMDVDMRSAVCNNYPCTIFEKEETQIICFETGIAFVVGNNVEKEILENNYMANIEKINIDASKTYKIALEEKELIYSYIFVLYKFILLNLLDKKMEDKAMFYKNRQFFVKFVQTIYNNKITDNAKANKLISEWEDKFELEKLYISVENKFELLYKNIKLDNHENMFRIIIILLIVLIIIGTINLGNWIM